MPSVSIGMKDVWAPALLADSGPATPSMAPLPNRRRIAAASFNRIRNERRQGGAAARHTPRTDPSDRAARPSLLTVAEIGVARDQAGVRLAVDVRHFVWRSRLGMISTSPNMPILTDEIEARRRSRASRA